MNNDLYNEKNLNNENAPLPKEADVNGTENTADTPEKPTEPAASIPTAEAPADDVPAVEAPEAPVPDPEPTPAPAPVTNSHVYTSYNPAPMPKEEPPKQKKNKKSGGVSRGALAVVCICTILLSCASGFLGAYFATAGETGPVTDTPQPDAPKDPTVIYQSSANPSSGMSADNGTTKYFSAAELVHASVVEITTEHLVNSYFQYVTQGAGSGIIISADGYIITNNHVIADTDNGNTLANSITVRMTDGAEYEATVVGTDADSDIAILKIEAENLPAAVIGDSDKLAVGEEVLAVGNPLGELGGTVTNGIISALDREINVDGTKMNLLQTNAAINPGNSGGGLFNMAGELIGVVNAKSSGTGIEGLGFAIPVNDAIHIAEQLMTQGYVSGKPYLGLSLYDITTPTQALYYNLRHLGVYVIAVEEGTNDDIFKQGDRIIAVDGLEISTSDDVAAIIKTFAVGDTIKVTIYRNGKMLEVYATAYEKIPTTSQSVEFEK